MSELHPIFTGILATFAQNYEAKAAPMSEAEDNRRARAEATAFERDYSRCERGPDTYVQDIEERAAYREAEAMKILEDLNA